MADLVTPRVVCIGKNGKHYPGSPFEIGQILVLGKYADGKEKYAVLDQEGFPDILLLKRVVDDHPHLFRTLEWHERRTEEEMPEYVKSGGEIFKAYKWYDEDVQVESDGSKPKRFMAFGCIPKDTCRPATKEEYIAYQKQLKG